MLPRLFTIALLAVCLVSPLSSQRVTQRAGLSAPAPAATTAPSLRRETAPSHWVRGAIIGGGIGFVIGLFFTNPFDSDNGGGGIQRLLTLTGVGAMIGALIGSGFRRHR